MNLSFKIEELGMFLLGVFLFYQMEFVWWWFLVLILAPDIGALGYLVSPKIGVVSYNLFHHKGIAIAIYFLGVYLQNQGVQLAGIILFSHASLDRVFGYGLKRLDK